ncbi:alpha/beta fold hydrolase [Pseudonocardia spinosispora]|uniref:alpha/beta fold hydrolase n=1 Tax=Pseudonocardia spinosispora TaxID=103441 RepID=UPI00042681E3|nr:alpha/beta hydrolase [Pseudonocardia spinosispora]
MTEVDDRVTVEEVEFALPRAGITLRGRRRAGAGIPTLLLHGWLDNCASFAPLLHRAGSLAGELVAVDLPGHGLSDPVTSLTCSYFDHVATILELVHTQGWDRINLIGHSLGGALSSLVAGLRPGLIDRLVLIDAIGPLSQQPDSGRETIARYLDAYLADRPAPVYRSRGQAVMARVALADILLDTAQLLVERDLHPVPGGFSWRSDNRLRYPSPVIFTEPQVLSYLNSITAPTLLVHAERTALHEPFYPARFTAVPDMRQVTLPGGHHLHIENPDQVSEAILGFLTS